MRASPRRDRVRRRRSRRCSRRGSMRSRPEARRFLETLAICGRPMASELVCDACGVARERQSLVAMLRVVPLHSQQRLVGADRDLSRSDSRSARRPDRSRRGATDPRPHGAGARRAAKRRLRGAVRALSRRRRRRERGDSSRSRRARRPAPRSPSIGPRPSTGTRWRCRRRRPPRQRGREGLADALANAGRPAEAAEAYLRAAAEQATLQRVELQRRGAEQFLIGGHIDRGLDLIRTRARGHGHAVPRTHPARGAAAVCCGGAHGFGGAACTSCRRPVDDIDADALLRLDTCWSATTGLASWT